MKINISISSDVTIPILDSAAKSVRRKLKLTKTSYSGGLCAIATYQLWVDVGSPTSFVPVSVMVGDEEHVILYNSATKLYYDITADQFDYPNGVSNNADKRYKSRKKLNKVELGAAAEELANFLSRKKKPKTKMHDWWD